MPTATVPSCLTHFHEETLRPGLQRVRCRYHVERLQDNAFQRAEITLPTPLRNAAEQRRTEYLAGRWCARLALAHLGITGSVPPPGNDRAPQWPRGSVGSISHSQGIAEVLVADNRSWCTVGVDTEAWLSPQRADRLCRELLTVQERQALEGLTPIQRANRITLIFSAKESLFKALYPLTHQRFHFHDAQREQRHTLTLLTTLSPHWPRGTTVPFQWREHREGILSWIALPR